MKGPIINSEFDALACTEETRLMLQTLAAERPIMVATWGDAEHLRAKLSTTLGDNTRHYSGSELRQLSCIDKLPDDYLDMLIIDHTHSETIELDRALPAVLRVLRANASVIIFNRRNSDNCATPEALSAVLQTHSLDQIQQRHYLYNTRWQSHLLGRLACRVYSTLFPRSGKGFVLKGRKTMTTVRTLEWDTPTLAAEDTLAMKAERRSKPASSVKAA